MENKRRHDRNSCYLHGEITSTAQLSPIHVDIFDISESGMKIKAADTSKIPDEFTIKVPRRHIEEQGTVVRREEGELGVEIKASVATGFAKRGS